MSRCLRYDYVGADIDYGVKDHPITNMKNMGYKILQCEPFPIGDCYFFKVEKVIKPLAPYLSIMKKDWFSKEV